MNTTDLPLAPTVLVASIFAASVSLGFTMPLLAVSLNMVGASAAMIGLNAMSPAIGIVVVSLVAARLVRGIGARPCMMAAGTAFIALIFLLKVLPGFWLWFLLRFFIGCAAGLFWIIAEAWLNASLQSGMRSRIVGIFTIANALGLGIGPILIVFTGTGPDAFWVPIGLFAMATALLVLLDASDPPLKSTRAMALGTLLLESPIPFVLALVSGFVSFTQAVLLPIYMLRRGYAVEDGALALAAVLLGAVVFRSILPAVARRFPRRRLLACLVLVCLLSNVLLLLDLSPFAFGSTLVFWGGAAAAMYSASLTVIGDDFEVSSIAAASAALRGAYHLGNAVGPILSGLALDWTGHAGMAIACLIPTGITLAGFSVPAIHRRSHPRPKKIQMGVKQCP